jgi:hypothetical protein
MNIKKPNFTAGPWNDGKHITICNQDGAQLSIGFLSTDNEDRYAEGFANAKLIAASPAIAEALAAIVELNATEWREFQLPAHMKENAIEALKSAGFEF